MITINGITAAIPKTSRTDNKIKRNIIKINFLFSFFSKIFHPSFEIILNNYFRLFFVNPKNLTVFK